MGGVEGADVCPPSSYSCQYDPVTPPRSVSPLAGGPRGLTHPGGAGWPLPADMPGLDWAPADRDAVRRIATMDLARK